MIKEINEKLFSELIDSAKNSPRKRSHKNFHSDFSEPVQRVFIGLTSGTYVRPHKHPQSIKWEMIVGIKGKTGLLIFDDNGTVTQRLTLSSTGVELPPNTWHTVFPLDEESVIMEIKQGPYNPDDISAFAEWAPEENSDSCSHFLNWLENAQLKDNYSE
jgi:cupin fold WbuC family metalloprotein